MTAAALLRARRVAGLIRKESIQILRDPSSIVIAGVLPLVLLFLFGFGISFDLQRVGLCVVVEEPTPAANSFAESFLSSRFFSAQVVRDRRTCAGAIVSGQVKGIVVLASDFADRIARGDTAPIQVVVDGSDPNTGGLVSNYVQGVWQTWRAQNAVAGGDGPVPGAVLMPRVWYNPDINSRDYLLPGLVAIVMSLIGTLLTALVVAREWERGTMEALMATPIGIAEIVIGKVTPYFLLGMAAMAVTVAMAIGLFDVPFRGSFALLALVSAVFLAGTLATGLLISTLARNQFVASQAALFAAFLPPFMLSGLIFEIASMPLPIRLFTYVLPARYFVSSLQTLFLAGDVGAVLVPDMAAMGAVAAVLFALTARLTPTRLE